ncbi:MAG TPA: DUF1634 domain-containing protein [Nitrososphaerales archaeon]|nr:DUF1634 domain-containing protein [Nitrososphaerales archaeon]
MNLKDPEAMTAVVGNVLRYGVLISAIIIVFGAIELIAASGNSDVLGSIVYNPDKIPHGTFDVSLSGLASGLAGVQPYALIELGAIVLIATPVSRVLISVFLFAAEGDKLYAVVTAVVLFLLLFSILVTPFIPGFQA